MNNLRNRNIDRASLYATNTVRRIMVGILGWMVVAVMVMSMVRFLLMVVNPPCVLQQGVRTRRHP
jgi:hypothetical protein